MTDAEIHLKCLELALVQAKNEGKHGDIERVAEIETRFYTLCNAGKASAPEPETEEGPAQGKRKRRGQPDPIFG